MSRRYRLHDSAALGSSGSSGTSGSGSGTSGTSGGMDLLVVPCANSITIGTGSKSFNFTTPVSAPNLLGFAVGSRLRAISSSNTANWMEGLVTAIDPGGPAFCTVSIDATNGSGTFSDFTLYVTGLAGSSGVSGASGTSGVSGTSGSSGSSGSSGVSGSGGTSGTSGSSGTSATNSTTPTATDYVLLVSDYYLEVTASGHSITVPSSGSGAATGKEFIVKLMVAGTATLVATSLIDGQSALTLSGQYSWIHIRSDGTTWNTIASSLAGTSGSSGTSGAAGAAGSNGTSGTSGSSGTSGAAGGSGTSGTSGSSGASSSTVYQRLNADFSTTSGSATATNFTFGASTSDLWIIDAQLTCSTGSTGGIEYQITAPTSSTIEGWIYSTDASGTLTATRLTATGALTGAIHGANVTGSDHFFITVSSGTNGNITLAAASAVAGNTSKILHGSSLVARKATSV